MVKLTKKQKLELQRNEPRKEKYTTHLNSISIRKIFQTNWLLMLGLVFLCFGLYFNSIDNELTLVDDVQGFIQREDIKDFKTTLKGHNIQRIVYSASYQLFDYNPMPLRLVSVSLHAFITLEVFVLIYLLFNRKTAIIASLVFAVHPVNTEAVTWISGVPYLYIAFFTFLILIFFTLFKKYREKKIFLVSAVLVYLFMIFFQSSPWILIVPLVLVIVDQFLIEIKVEVTKSWWLMVFAIPVSIYLLTQFSAMYAVRASLREGTSGERVTLHTQALKPVIQGYPYTTHLMAKLYAFPKTLSVYYDGMEVTSLLLLSMYITFFAYVGLVIYLWKKNRRLLGIFLLFPFLIAPAYSPIKITWFLAERYLYAGTAFFGVLVALLVDKIEEKTHKKILIYSLFTLLLLLYAFRTFVRNNDWQNTETLSYANMKSSPLSVRPYNDIGGHYYQLGDISKAVEWYERGLLVLPTSGTAINNLGYIYLEYGPLIFRDDFSEPVQNPEEAQRYFGYAQQLNQKGADVRTISFFMNKALALDMNSIDLGIAAADLYFGLKLPHFALPLYDRILNMDPDNEIARVRVLMLQEELRN